MNSKPRSAISLWLSAGSTRWMLVLGFFLGAMSCSHDDPKVDETVAKGDPLAESLTSEETPMGNAAAKEAPTDQEPSAELGAPNVSETGDDLEKTFASLTTSDSASDRPNSFESDAEAISTDAQTTNGTQSSRAQKKQNKGNPTTLDTNGSSRSKAPVRIATYVVASNDSLSKIAKKIYSDPKYWKDIAEQNGFEPPYVIIPGQGIKFPLLTAQAKSFAESYRRSQKTVTVQKGDTLSKLASKIFGNPDSWRKLFNYNKDKIQNPDQLPAGMTLAYFDPTAKPVAELKLETQPPSESPKPETTPAAKSEPPASAAPVETPPKMPKKEEAPIKMRAKGFKPRIKISPTDLNSP